MKVVTYSRDAAGDLRRHGTIASRIMSAVEEYAADTQAHTNNVKQLAGSGGKRLRMGGYRVIFEETQTSIIVTKVGPRGDVYDRL